MVEREEPGRDLAGLVVPLAGRLVVTRDRWEPYRLVDADGTAVGAAGAYFGHLQAVGRAELTVRSYGLDLLRWFRFLWASGVAWDRAGRSEARDFCRWLQLAGKPVRPHWRERCGPGMGAAAPVAGGVYPPSVRAHSETVLRGFMTSTGGRAPGRWSTRSRWTGPGGAGGPVRTAGIRWSLTALSAAACTGRRCPRGSLAVSRMRTSMRSPLPALAPGPGPGGVLRLYRGAGVGVAVGDPRRH